MIKTDRNYLLSVEAIGGQKLTLGLPLTVEFEVKRDTLASANTATFRVFNLTEQKRNLLYKDRYDTEVFRAIQFRAGYDRTTPMVFNGTVSQCYSQREGTNMVTTIEAYDGAFQMTNGWTAFTQSAGATAADTIRTLARSLPGNLAEPIVGTFNAISKRGEVLFGNTWDLIVGKTGGLANIDNGQVKALQDDEVFVGVLPVIESASGLLNSPRRSQATLVVDILFEPRLTVGQVLELRSTTNRLFNGRYKVMGLHHRGTISPAVGGTYQTTASLWLGTQALRAVAGAPIQ